MKIPQYLRSTQEVLQTQWNDNQAFRLCECILDCYGCYKNILKYQSIYDSHQQQINHCRDKLEAFSRYHPLPYQHKVERLLAACFAYDWETTEALAHELIIGLPKLSLSEETDYFYPLYSNLKSHLEGIKRSKPQLDATHHRLRNIISEYRASIHGKVAHSEALEALFDELLRRTIPIVVSQYRASIRDRVFRWEQLAALANEPDELLHRITEESTMPTTMQQLQHDDAQVHRQILALLPITSEGAEEKQEPRSLKRSNTDTLSSPSSSKQKRSTRKSSATSTQRERTPSPRRNIS